MTLQNIYIRKTRSELSNKNSCDYLCQINLKARRTYCVCAGGWSNSDVGCQLQ